MSSHLTPLEVCERLIAPVKELGTLIGYKEKAAYAWRSGSQWRAAGDMPPDANRRLLRLARERNIPLTERHLIWGAERAEIDALTRENDRRSEVAAE